MSDQTPTPLAEASATRQELMADASSLSVPEESGERAAKRQRTDDPAADSQNNIGGQTSVVGEGQHDAPINGNGSNGRKDDRDSDKTRGMAPIKKEYLLDVSSSQPADVIDDDAAEGRVSSEQNGRAGGDSRDRDGRDGGGKRGKKDRRDKKQGGQNTERTFGRFQDAIPLCNSRALSDEFSPQECRFGERCRMTHDLRKYLEEGRRPDVETLGGECPVYKAHGRCSSGWKCRFVKSHMKEVEHEDGRKELVLLGKAAPKEKADGTANGDTSVAKETDQDDERPGVFNVVPMEKKINLNRKRVEFSRADQFINWIDREAKVNQELNNRRKDDQDQEGLQELRAQFTDPPFKPSEKRRLYFGPETPALAPLTTQGNLPFRRLCVELGAQLTYSEMAMGMPLLQGSKADWPLLKVHESELTPPKFNGGGNANADTTTSPVPVFDGYDNTRDIRFGAQIAASQPWVATKSADILNRYLPHLRLIDLNCGCPIDMIFKSGGGSALLDNHNKLERMVRGMSAVSGETPITAKIRMGIKTGRPTAQSVISKLAFGSRENREREGVGAPGCAAITLHGRSREQRYTKLADWSYIAECAALIKSYNEQKDLLTDTAHEPDPSTLPPSGRLFFLGNGDCYSHEDYLSHITNSGVDTVMIGRGALVKPWLFEEIEKGQYLDKSASERLGYVEKFVRYGLDAWGSDELGIGFTRRFLLEWLSFSHRYVPLGLLERLPPSLNDRPPAYRGRNEMETLLASGNYKDWIKISEMFLGPVHPGFQFQPKHKSNAYEAEG